MAGPEALADDLRRCLGNAKAIPRPPHRYRAQMPVEIKPNGVGTRS